MLRVANSDFRVMGSGSTISRPKAAFASHIAPRRHSIPMANTIQDQIQTRIQSFVAELTQLVRAAAIDSVQSALGSQSGGARRGPGRPRGSSSGSGSVRATVPTRGRKRGRRSSQDVDTLTAKFLGYVKSNDG